MNCCQACNATFRSFTVFARHMVREHGIDREAIWRRIEQTGGDPLTAVRSERGRWYLYVQGSLQL